MTKKIRGYDWFKKKLKMTGLSQRQLSVKLNSDPASFSKVINGYRKLQMDEAELIADLFNMPISLVLFQFDLTELNHFEIELKHFKDAFSRQLESDLKVIHDSY